VVRCGGLHLKTGHAFHSSAMEKLEKKDGVSQKVFRGGGPTVGGLFLRGSSAGFLAASVLVETRESATYTEPFLSPLKEAKLAGQGAFLRPWSFPRGCFEKGFRNLLFVVAKLLGKLHMNCGVEAPAPSSEGRTRGNLKPRGWRRENKNKPGKGV